MACQILTEPALLHLCSGPYEGTSQKGQFPPAAAIWAGKPGTHSAVPVHTWDLSPVKPLMFIPDLTIRVGNVLAVKGKWTNKSPWLKTSRKIWLLQPICSHISRASKPRGLRSPAPNINGCNPDSLQIPYALTLAQLHTCRLLASQGLLLRFYSHCLPNVRMNNYLWWLTRRKRASAVINRGLHYNKTH